MDQNLPQQHTYLLTAIHWALSAVALMMTAYVVPGFKVGRFLSALFTAIVIGFANAFLRPFLMFIAFPINILTLGLFTFVINGAVLKICAAFLPQFEIRSWISAIIGAIILSCVSGILHYFLI